MERARTAFRFLSRAPHHAGALFLALATLTLSSCEQKEETPDWKESKKEGQSPPPAPLDQPDQPDQPDPPAPASTNDDPGPAGPAGPQHELRFLSYNLKNYLTMSRYVDGQRQDRSKPEKEIAALIELITSARPDVLGICEIGTPDDLADLQRRLKEAGLDLPHTEYAGGADETRHLALLSRHPLAATNSQSDLSYQLLGKEFTISRGILDATVKTRGKSVRFLGVHLKSKREVPEGDQELIRRNEAYLLRTHADRILAEDPDALLCVYGDFNDTRRTVAVRSIQGPTNSSRFLEALSVKDSRGEVWTHYWDYQHIYSRFDYVLASRSLRPLYDWKGSYILDAPNWSVASDHRALLTIFKWAESAPADDEPAPQPE